MIRPVFAHCPLCTIAAGSMVLVTRQLGVDDVVVGTFIGAFIVSTAFWTSNFIVKKFKKKLPFQEYLLSVAFVISTVASFYWGKLLGTMPPFLYVFGLERLLFGIIAGSVISIAAFELHNVLRRANGNRNNIPFQGMLFPIAVLVIANIMFYVTGVI